MKSWKKVILAGGAFAVAAVAFLLCGRESTGPRVSRDRAPAALIPSVSPQGERVARAGCAADQWATNQLPTVRGTLPFVLTSVQPFGKRLRLAAESLGAKTVAVLSGNSLLVEADAAARARLSADGRFSGIEEFLPSGKVQPELSELVSGGAEFVDVSIVALAGADRQIVQTCLEQGGGEMLTGCINEGDTLRARLPAALVADLAGRGDVRWMERFERPVQLNDRAVEQAAMAVREVWETHGLTGAGQLVSTSDSGIDTGSTETMHADLKDRVLDIRRVDDATETDVSGHGTHTAGSIVGTGAMSSGAIRGTAHEAHLYAWFCGSPNKESILQPQTLSLLYTADGEWNAHLHSASWGDSTVPGQYTTECAEHDQYVWANPEYLPVFSAGNSGPTKSSIGSPGASKNVLTVGATQNLREGHDGSRPNGDPTQTTSFSSRGPCRDGRIKPDIAAPGAGIVSVRSSAVEGESPLYGVYEENENYLYCSGTSMACPLTAGAVALVRQWLVERMGFADVDGQRPTAALMKAVITGGAKDAATPNNEQGWGRVDLENTLFPSDRAVKLVDRIPFAEGGVFEYVVETTNAAPLDVQLCWIDYPGSAIGLQSSARLVNDLDLTVEPLDVGGDVMWGNGGTAADTVNNMESVRIASAEPRKYLITVTCKSVLYDYEDGGAAALYVRGAFDPEATPTGLDRVRIRRDPATTYMSLDRALAAVQEGDTVEILRPHLMKQPVEVGVSCTIVATNENPFASAVNCWAGGLSIGSGARVLFQNVAFTNASSVTVAAGGVAALAGQLALGPVTTADDAGIELAGTIENSVTVTAPGMDLGEVFGTVSSADAAESAKHFLNAADGELDGLAVGGRLQWGVAPVEDAEAVVRLTLNGTTTNFRSLRTLFKCVTNDAEIAVLKDCTLSETVSIANKIVFAGGTEDVTLTASGEAGFDILGGSLTVSNLTMTGSSPDALFRVGELDGLAGELVFGRDAVVSDFTVTSSESYCGAVCVLNGCATLGEGSSLLRCWALGSSSFGGGVYAYGEDASVALDGTSITGCSATMWGGGVWADYGAQILISGATVVTGNTVNDTNWGTVEDDIYSSEPVQVTGPVTSTEGSIGIEVDGLVSADDAFALYDPHAVGSAADSAAAFFNVKDDSLRAAFDASNETFVWEGIPETKTTDEEHATVRVIYPGATTNYYETLAIAFSDLQGDCRVEMMTNSIALRSDLEVNGNVTLTTDPSLDNPALLHRWAGSITVNAGAALILTNLTMSGLSREEDQWLMRSSKRLLYVDGGSLVLENGAGVRRFCGMYSRDASAVVVYDKGTFTMKDGSFVESCTNAYVDTVKDVQTGTGGGVLIDVDSTAHLEGGRIVNCASTYGGLAVCNRSTAYVSGSFLIKDNTDLAGEASDLMVEDLSTLILDAPLTSATRIGWSEGYRVDTDVASDVPDWTSQWTAATLATDAAKFFRSGDLTVRGIAVTNATDAKIVWRSALDTDGCYRDASGEVYCALPEAPNPDADPAPESEFPVAFKSIARISDVEWALVITNRVQNGSYRLLWTKDLSKGFTTTGAWETATTAGEWTTNILFSAPAPTSVFWKAEGKAGESAAE